MLEINRKKARIWSLLGMRRVLGLMLQEIIKVDESFVFVTADVARYFGTEAFEKGHPEHFVDVGIAEQNMVTVAAGIQKEGANALAATYATFITARALDQIRVSLGVMQLPVILVGVGAGLAEGDLSATHMGLEDVAVMRAIPNIRIVEPADSVELVKTLYATIEHPYPVYIRLTGRTNLPVIYKEDYDFQIGKAVTLKEGSGKAAIISAGVITDVAIKAAEALQKNGISLNVINMHTIKPIDEACLKSIFDYEYIFVIEEHMKNGGLGSAIAEYYVDKAKHPKIITFGVEDYYPNANDYEELLKECKLTVDSIACKIKDILGKDI